MSKKKKICISLIILVVLWLTIGTIDFVRVNNFEKPIFCIETKIDDDGGSKHCIGLGYSVDIEGNFTSENELPGVTEFSFYIFGIRIESGVKD